MLNGQYNVVKTMKSNYADGDLDDDDDDNDAAEDDEDGDDGDDENADI